MSETAAAAQPDEATRDMGFHPGELAVQRRADVQDAAANLADMLQPAELSGKLAASIGDRTFLVLAARANGGRLWTTVVVGPPGFLEVRTPRELVVHGTIAEGDPLARLPAGQSIGMTAIDFATRRRIRINGRLDRVADDHVVVEVEQAYGNCPQYIQQRRLTPVAGRPPSATSVHVGTGLEADDVELVRAADTFFLGTIHPGRGADASHRGGPPGFVRVEGQTLWWPDYKGNNLFNSFGNLEASPEAALLFVDFERSRTLHVSGTCEIQWGPPGRPGDDGGTGRIAAFAIHGVVSGSRLPVVATDLTPYPRNPALSIERSP